MPSGNKNVKGTNKSDSFVELCSNFKDACESMNFGDDSFITDMLDNLKMSTKSSTNYSETDLTAIKVVNLLLPALGVMTYRQVETSFKTQQASIIKLA